MKVKKSHVGINLPTNTKLKAMALSVTRDNQYSNTGCLEKYCCYQQPRTGTDYRQLMDELSRDNRYLNDEKLVVACHLYLQGLKEIDDFYFLHGDLYNCYIKQWHRQVDMAKVLKKLGAVNHAVTIKFRDSYSRVDCVRFASQFIRNTDAELSKLGSSIEYGFAIAEPDKIPAYRDETIHFHMSWWIHTEECLDAKIHAAIVRAANRVLDNNLSRAISAKNFDQQPICNKDQKWKWILYSAKSAQFLGQEVLDQCFIIDEGGLSVL